MERPPTKPLRRAAAAMPLLLIVGCGAPSDRPSLLVYCAAIARGPMEEIADRYEQQRGVRIDLQFGGSNTLLGKAALSGVGDLLLAADTSYLDIARDRGILEDWRSVAATRPVLVVHPNATERVVDLDSLLADGVRVALANPDTAALGHVTRQAFQQAGRWPAIKQRVENAGVFTPTAPAVASAVALGGADAGVVWRVLAEAHEALVVIEPQELTTHQANLAAGVLISTTNPPAAEAFLVFLADASQGGAVFTSYGFEAPGPARAAP